MEDHIWHVKKIKASQVHINYLNLANLKKAGRSNKIVFSRERVNPCFFVTFNIFISHSFLENLIEIP